MAARLTHLILILALLTLVGCGDSTPPATVDVTIKGERFTLELSRTHETRELGMMGREAIGKNEGMLFVFPDVDMRGFWMGNCLVDIDIAFLDGRGNVTAVHTMRAESPRRDDETESDYNRRLPKYSSRYPSQFAIELQAGTLQRLGVAFEDRIELDLAQLKAWAE